MHDADSALWAFPITKIEKTDGGASRVVFGKATGPDLDLDDQIIDADFARRGLEAWFKSFGNIRQMHSTSLPPAGKAVELEYRGDDAWVRAKVVEPTAIKLVDERVYTSFSVGISRPKIIRDAVAKNGRIVDGVFSEISLVDFPANPTAKFSVLKVDPDGEFLRYVARFADQHPDPKWRDRAVRVLEERRAN